MSGCERCLESLARRTKEGTHVGSNEYPTRTYHRNHVKLSFNHSLSPCLVKNVLVLLSRTHTRAREHRSFIKTERPSFTAFNLIYSENKRSVISYFPSEVECPLNSSYFSSRNFPDDSSRKGVFTSRPRLAWIRKSSSQLAGSPSACNKSRDLIDIVNTDETGQITKNPKQGFFFKRRRAKSREY